MTWCDHLIVHMEGDMFTLFILVVLLLLLAMQAMLVSFPWLGAIWAGLL